MRALGRDVLEPSRADVEPVERERARGVARRAVVTSVIVIVVVIAAVQWLRPVPAPVFQSALTSLRLPGALPALPWPSTGSAALSVVGAGSLGQSGSSTPVPIGGLTKVMTALVVLRAHPIAGGAAGPAIPVTASDVSDYQADAAGQQSVVPVALGETLTEEQALEGLLVASGNNVATLLAAWDAGGTTPFVAKMNAEAHRLGLTSTEFGDPSGVSSGSQSTPTDLIRLGEAAMAIAAFRHVVAMTQVTLPVGGTFYSLDTDLGHDGFAGIKTGSDAAAGGCFLFEATTSFLGRELSLVGVVLGQREVPETPTAVKDADALVRTAWAAVAPIRPVSSTDVGQVVGSWGPDVAVVTSSPSSALVAWPGTSVPVRLRIGSLPTSIPAGARIGQLEITVGSEHLAVDLRTRESLPGPSPVWRLTRF